MLLCTCGCGVAVAVLSRWTWHCAYAVGTAVRNHDRSQLAERAWVPPCALFYGSEYAQAYHVPTQTLCTASPHLHSHDANTARRHLARPPPPHPTGPARATLEGRRHKRWWRMPSGALTPVTRRDVYVCASAVRAPPAAEAGPPTAGVASRTAVRQRDAPNLPPRWTAPLSPTPSLLPAATRLPPPLGRAPPQCFSGALRLNDACQGKRWTHSSGDSTKKRGQAPLEVGRDRLGSDGPARAQNKPAGGPSATRLASPAVGPVTAVRATRCEVFSVPRVGSSLCPDSFTPVQPRLAAAQKRAGGESHGLEPLSGQQAWQVWPVTGPTVKF